jgi:hypothetical protein
VTDDEWMAYRPQLVKTLKNLASLYRDVNRSNDAKAVEAELAAVQNTVTINGEP